MQLGPITEIEGSIFGVRANTRRPYEFPDDVHTIVSYEFDLNMYRIDREAYNTLDWLGDLGGLKEALAIVFGFLTLIFNKNKFENFMVSKLYRSETKKDKTSRKSKGKGTSFDEEDLYLQKDEGNKLDLSKPSCFKQWWYDIGLPPFIKWLKRSKEQRLFAKGRNYLEKETDIVDFMQQFRILQKTVALKLKLNFEEKKFVENNRFPKIQLSGPGTSSSEDEKMNSKYSPIKSASSLSLKLRSASDLDNTHHMHASELFTKKRVDHNKIRQNTMKRLATLKKTGSLEKQMSQLSADESAKRASTLSIGKEGETIDVSSQHPITYH